MNPALNVSERIFKSAFLSKASDIHFYPFSNKAHIYFRVHGKRRFHKTIVQDQYKLLLTYYKFSSGMDIGEIRKPQSGTLTYLDTAIKYSLRISTLPVNNSESLAIRILPQEDKIDLSELFLFSNQYKSVQKWITHRSGIILLTGPTGSGKSTTLYALLQYILNESQQQIITLEDPIEKKVHDILQVQINKKAGITFQSGLKSVLRHDPDIIMIGEIRDKETVRFAFEAALTGHLVLSTLHAKDAFGTIQRLLEMGIKRSDLEQSLIAIGSLKLLPIQVNNHIVRRAAILELLDGNTLKKGLSGSEHHTLGDFNTFNYLRKKAYAYGFISEETYNTTQ